MGVGFTCGGGCARRRFCHGLWRRGALQPAMHASRCLHLINATSILLHTSPTCKACEHVQIVPCEEVQAPARSSASCPVHARGRMPGACKRAGACSSAMHANRCLPTFVHYLHGGTPQRAHPNAPRMPPNAPRMPPNAPRMPPNAPRMPPNVPRMPSCPM